MDKGMMASNVQRITLIAILTNHFYFSGLHLNPFEI